MQSTCIPLYAEREQMNEGLFFRQGTSEIEYDLWSGLASRVCDVCSLTAQKDFALGWFAVTVLNMFHNLWRGELTFSFLQWTLQMM